MKLFLFLILSVPIFLSCQDVRESKGGKIIGVKVYDFPGELNDLFGQLESAGINTLFVSPMLARRSGFRSSATAHGMPVFLIVPTFYNPEVLAEDSTLYAITAGGEKAVDDWVEFVCPNRKGYRKHHLDYLKSLVRELTPDGISIDFIRYFVYWEKVSPDQTIVDLPQTCFDDTCLAAFADQYKVRYPEYVKKREEKADYILSNYPVQWTEFKVKTITSYVREITSTLKTIDPSIQFNLHLIPWRETDFKGAIRKIAGQDVEDLGPLVDYISPMCYTHMVKQPPEWVHEVVVDIDPATTGKVLPSIQVSRAYLEESFSTQDFQKTLQSALDEPSRGVIFWSWEALIKDQEKLEVVKDEIVTK